MKELRELLSSGRKMSLARFMTLVWFFLLFGYGLKGLLAGFAIPNDTAFLIGIFATLCGYTFMNKTSLNKSEKKDETINN